MNSLHIVLKIKRVYIKKCNNSNCNCNCNYYLDDDCHNKGTYN